MKHLLDWKDRKVVKVFDEITIWSAPFGRLLLENIPMQSGDSILDIGFGTGFPLIELAQRYGNNSKIYGMDIWEEGISHTKQKIKTLGLENIVIFHQSATEIPLNDNTIDLVTSNLGINNFEDKIQVYQEIYRVLNDNGHLCLTTNLVGTFHELFKLFKEVFSELKINDSIIKLEDYIRHRSISEIIKEELKGVGFIFEKEIRDNTNLRFVDAESVLDHSLIRIGFRAGWETLIPDKNLPEFYSMLKIKIQQVINDLGVFTMSIPVLYLQFLKKDD